jgi:hypothetical protein
MPVILLLLVVAFVAKFAWILAAFAAVASIGWAAGWWLAGRDDRAVAERRRQAELRARADRQQRWALARDDRGAYGNYIPEQIA